MAQLLGEFECKIDAKGRLRLPAALLSQFVAFGSNECVIHRGIETCLVLYPTSIWTAISARINALNDLIKKNRAFKRYFFRGATRLTPDSSDRILIPKGLIEYAKIEKTVVVQAMNDKIEIWAKSAYADLVEQEPEDFSDLAEEVGTNMAPALPVNPVNILPNELS